MSVSFASVCRSPTNDCSQSDHARTARQQRRTHRYGELGELLGMSPRNVTVLVDGLEKEQLVRRVPHERDGARPYIEITEKGKGVAAAILAPHKKAIADSMIR